jgi:hypothetical protein
MAHYKDVIAEIGVRNIERLKFGNRSHLRQVISIIQAARRADLRDRPGCMGLG